jgi:hypothetical protein
MPKWPRTDQWYDQNTQPVNFQKLNKYHLLSFRLATLFMMISNAEALRPEQDSRRSPSFLSTHDDTDSLADSNPTSPILSPTVPAIVPACPKFSLVHGLKCSMAKIKDICPWLHRPAMTASLLPAGVSRLHVCSPLAHEYELLTIPTTECWMLSLGVLLFSLALVWSSPRSPPFDPSYQAMLVPLAHTYSFHPPGLLRSQKLGLSL